MFWFRTPVLVVALAVFLLRSAYGQTFFDIDIERIDDSAIGGSVTWADFNADGNLDLFLTGSIEPISVGSSGLISRFYRHLGLQGTLQGVIHRVFEHDLPTGVWLSDASSGDVDADGDLDLFLCGSTTLEKPYLPYAALFETVDDRTMTERQTLTGMYGCSGDWGDFDNDGDLDLVASGAVGPGQMRTILYENDGGVLHEAEIALPPVGFGEVRWADVDADGDLDLAISGMTADNVFFTDVLINEGGRFGSSGSAFEPVAYGSVAWGDFDNDGDLDLLVTGAAFGPTLLTPSTALYQNDGAGGFTRLPLSIDGKHSGRAIWGDLKNTGTLDVLSVGTTASFVADTDMLANVGGTFRQSNNECPIPPGNCLPYESITLGTAAVFDVDNDHDLDLMLIGLMDGERFIQLDRNGGIDIPGPDSPIVPLNLPPTAPSELTSEVDGLNVQLSWGPASDTATPEGEENVTPPSGLSYNVRVGSTPGGVDVVPPMSIVATGKRQVVDIGNAGPNRFFRLILAPGTYYWSVQAVDHSFAGSPFSEEGRFTVEP